MWLEMHLQNVIVQVLIRFEEAWDAWNFTKVVCSHAIICGRSKWHLNAMHLGSRTFEEALDGKGTFHEG